MFSDMFDEEFEELRRLRKAFKWLEERYKGTWDLRMDSTSIHEIKHWRGPSTGNLLTAIEKMIEKEND